MIFLPSLVIPVITRQFSYDRPSIS
jgi:hypothetical protein